MPDPVRVGPWVTGYLGHWYREFPDYLFACRVGTDGWVVVGPMAIFHGEIIASGPEDGDEGKRRADAAAEAQGWTLERDPATEPREVPRIVMDPARMTGEPTIGESRLTVRMVLGLIVQGYSDAQILASYDYLTQEGLDAARAWWESPEGTAWALGKIAELDEVRLDATPGPNRVRDAAVIAEIMAERERAYAKWGPQPYPWTCGEDDDFNGLHEIAERLERVARDAMAERAAKGLPPTRAQIVAEEAGEALREIDPKRARKELIQLGAMVIAALSECPYLRKEE